MSRKGNCWDNAWSESFFATLEKELVGDGVFDSMREAELEISAYIEGFYNRKRRHSSLGKIVRPYKRRTEDLGEAFKRLFVEDLATRDFEPALRALTGEEAPQAFSLPVADVSVSKGAIL